jgi:hypothetical protein
MHPSRDELIDLLDGGGAPEAAEHAASCPSCMEALDEMRGMASALRDLPPHRPPADAWPALRRELRAKPAAGWLSTAIAALLLALLSASFVVLVRQAPPQESASAVSEKQAIKEKIEPLKARSRTLESALASYKNRSQVLSGRTAGTMAYLEDGLAIVDLQLSLLQTPDAEPDKVLRLWEERVRLLTALVELNTTRGTVTPI